MSAAWTFATLLVATLVGSIALLADFFLRFTFWGSVTGRRGGSRDSGGGGRDRDGHRGPDPVDHRADHRQIRQMAVSRQREYLADASSVELTRNPYGLQRALSKISSDREVLEVANRATPSTLYFVNPIKKWEERASGLMATPADR